MEQTYRTRIIKLIEEQRSRELFSFLDSLRGPYAAAYILNALMEDEISERAAEVFNKLIAIIDPKQDKFDWGR